MTLRQGVNRLLVKLVKRGEDMHFTLAFRHQTGQWGRHHQVEDWMVDLSDRT